MLQRVQHFLHGLMQAILPVAQSLGGPGLALVAFLDSSFLSFPEVADAVIVVLTVSHPARWFYYGAMTTVGSTLGCLALFLLARKGGEAFLAKWVSPRVMERWFGLFKRYGLFTVVLASILPPPVPFKPFVVLAGAANVSIVSFLTAVVAGRGIRYIGEAWLAYRYGDGAMQYINDNFARASLWLAGVLLTGGLLFLLWKRLRPGYNTKPAA
ncbi:MAG: VTT domain-containing protein [Acidobacteria bacterium]|nr:VTT domain-containing protein [Acidobacteriota bacterium]